MSVLVRPHFGNQKHRTSLCKSTEVLPQKYGTFMQRSPMFLYFRNVRTLSYKKSFVKISYISYTVTANLLYSLAISGVGLGVG